MENQWSFNITRKTYKLGMLLLFVVLLGTGCTPAVYPITPEPSYSPIPITLTSTATLTPTFTLTPTSIPSPTITPTPDWETLTSEHLLALAPELPGYSIETDPEMAVVAHDRGRYVVYIDNRETLEDGDANPNFGRVGKVWNTEIQAFESAARSVYTTEVDGQRVDIRTLVVTSKEYEDRFHGHLEIPAEYDGLLSKHITAIAAVDMYVQNLRGPREDHRYSDTADLTDAQKDALVRACVEGGTFPAKPWGQNIGGGFLRDYVLPQETITLAGNRIVPNNYVVKIDYDRRVDGASIILAEWDAVVHTKSENDNFVLWLRTSQDLLEPVATRGTPDGVIYYNFLKYWEWGPVVQAVNTIGRNEFLFGRLGEHEIDTPMSVFRAVMKYAYGGSNYPNYPRRASRPGDYNPRNLYFPPLIGLPALENGEWLVGRYIRDENP